MYYLCNNRVFHSETALVLQSLALVRMDTREPFPKPCCQLRLGGGVQSSWFKIESGVRQRCMLAPDSFATSMDWMMERTVGHGINDVSFGRDSYADLDFAGDASLLAELLELRSLRAMTALLLLVNNRLLRTNNLNAVLPMYKCKKLN